MLVSWYYEIGLFGHPLNNYYAILKRNLIKNIIGGKIRENRGMRKLSLRHKDQIKVKENVGFKEFKEWKHYSQIVAVFINLYFLGLRL